MASACAHWLNAIARASLVARAAILPLLRLRRWRWHRSQNCVETCELRRSTFAVALAMAFRPDAEVRTINRPDKPRTKPGPAARSKSPHADACDRGPDAEAQLLELLREIETRMEARQQRKSKAGIGSQAERTPLR